MDQMLAKVDVFKLYRPVILLMMEEGLQREDQSVIQSKRSLKWTGVKREFSEALNQSSTLQLNSTQRQTERQCKICLDHLQTADNTLISPCMCTGTLSYVHDQCFRKWIQKQYSRKSGKQQAKFLKDGIQCELCKMKFALLYSFKIKICQNDSFCNKYNQSQLIFYLYMAFFIINFGCLSYLISNMVSSKIDLDSHLALSLVNIIGLAFLVITLLITSYHFINDYIIDIVWVLQGYKQKPAASKISQVAPLFVN